MRLNSFTKAELMAIEQALFYRVEGVECNIIACETPDGTLEALRHRHKAELRLVLCLLGEVAHCLRPWDKAI